MSDSLITKRALAEALKSLLKDEEFGKVSVIDICHCCNLNRNSFYYHFKDKYELANWIFYNEFVEEAQKFTFTNAWDFLEYLCEYFDANRIFYMKLFEVKGQNCFADYFAEIMGPIISQYFKEIFIDDMCQNFITVFFSDAVHMAVMRWLKEETKLTPHEFIELLKIIASGTAIKIIQDDNKH